MVRDDERRAAPLLPHRHRQLQLATARLYEDVGFLTCDPPVGADVTQLFNHLTGYSRAHDYHSCSSRRATARPVDRPDRARGVLRHRGPDHGQDELARRPRDGRGAVRGQPGRRADRPRGPRHLLPAARRAGHDRQHPRPLDPRPLPRALADLRFANGDEAASRCSSSARADWMPRNLDRRVEVLVPVEHPKHQAWLDQVFAIPTRRRHRALGDGWRRLMAAPRARAVHRRRRPGTLLPLGRRPPASVIRSAFALCSPDVHLGLRLADTCRQYVVDGCRSVHFPVPFRGMITSMLLPRVITLSGLLMDELRKGFHNDLIGTRRTGAPRRLRHRGDPRPQRCCSTATSRVPTTSSRVTTRSTPARSTSRSTATGSWPCRRRWPPTCARWSPSCR